MLGDADLAAPRPAVPIDPEMRRLGAVGQVTGWAFDAAADDEPRSHFATMVDRFHDALLRFTNAAPGGFCGLARLRGETLRTSASAVVSMPGDRGPSGAATGMPIDSHPAGAGERRLTAILAADIAGYSRLMGEDEAATVRDLKGHQAVVLPLVGSFGGAIVDTAGDGILATFPSAVRAMECAIAIQGAMEERNRDVPENRRMRFRIGVNLGDVIHEGSRVYGDGVNIAARLEELAEPGGVAISGSAHDQVDGKIDGGFEALGERSLKNIARPVRVYRAMPRGVASTPEAAAASSPDAPSIAVLPFDNMSADPAQAFFADGITEDITTALSRLKGFFVISRNTMFTYKGKAVNIRTIGRELGVRYVLEGSVRKAGDRIRVTAQLVDAATGNHLWGEHYDRNLDDIFAIQDEITASVVGRIGPELFAAEHARAVRKPPQSLDAWECTIRGLFLASRLEGEASLEAIALLDRAIREDPNYAQALGLKSWVIVWRAFQGWDSIAEAAVEVKSLSARAAAADEDEPWTWVARAMVGFSVRDNATATAGLARAVELNPNFAFGLGLLSLAHSFGGRSAEALGCLGRATRLSPREVFQGSFAQQYAFAHFQAGQYELALNHAQHAHAMRPGHPYAMMIGAASAGHLGEVRVAQELIAELKAKVPTITRGWIEETAPYIQPADRKRLGEGLALAGLA